MPVCCYPYVHLSFSCQLTLLVHRQIVVGLTSLFDWPVFFCLFSSVSPLPSGSYWWEHWSLAWIFTACLLDLLTYGFGHWASYGLSLHFGDSTLCISVFQFMLDFVCWKIMIKYFVVTWLWFWNASLIRCFIYSVLLICSVLWYLHACLPCLTPLQSQCACKSYPSGGGVLQVPSTDPTLYDLTQPTLPHSTLS